MIKFLFGMPRVGAWFSVGFVDTKNGVLKDGCFFVFVWLGGDVMFFCF